MARLPDVFERDTPEGGRNVIDMRPNLYGGVQQLGRAAAGVNQLEEQQRHAQAEFDTGTAESEFLASDVATTNSLEGDDFSNYVPTYQKAMQKARDDAANLITDPAARARFSQRAGVWMIRGTQRAHEKATLKEGDLGRASLVTTIDKNRVGAMDAGDETTRMGFISATQQAISGARGKGWIDAEQAATLSQKAANDYAVSAFELLPPEARIAALTGKTSDMSKSYNTKLSPEQETQYQGWLNTLPEKQRNTYDYDMRGAFKAGVQPSANGHFPDTYKKPNHPTFSDESQYASSGNPGRWDGDTYVPPTTSLDFIRPDQRAVLLERAQTELVQIKNAQGVAEREALEQGMVEAANAIDAGGQVDPNLYSKLSIDQRGTIDRYAERKSKGLPVETDWSVYQGIRRMSDDQLREANLADYRDKLSDAEYKQVIDLQAGLRHGAEDALQDMSTYRSEQTVFNSTMYQLGVDPDKAKSDPAVAAKVDRFQHAFDVSLYQMRQRLGRKNLSPDETQKALDDLIISTHVPGSTFLGMEFGEQDYRIDDIPVVEADKIRKTLQARGAPANNAAVVAAWAKIQQALQ